MMTNINFSLVVSTVVLAAALTYSGFILDAQEVALQINKGEALAARQYLVRNESLILQNAKLHKEAKGNERTIDHLEAVRGGLDLQLEQYRNPYTWYEALEPIEHVPLELQIVWLANANQQCKQDNEGYYEFSEELYSDLDNCRRGTAEELTCERDLQDAQEDAIRWHYKASKCELERSK